MGGMIGAWRSLGQDSSVIKQNVKPGTAKRTLLYAVPYSGLLALFLLVVVVDAAIGVVNPLIYRQIINKGILQGNSTLIIHLAIIAALLGLSDGALGMAQTYLSSRISAGIVLSLRTRLFEHIQQMPLAFFTRAQTGALVSRLNNDVTGARTAFADILSNVVGNLIGCPDPRCNVCVVVAHYASRSGAASVVCVPCALLGPQAATDHAGELRLDFDDEQPHG
jgi:ATP-binding cassette subfamily B protein